MRNQATPGSATATSSGTSTNVANLSAACPKQRHRGKAGGREEAEHFDHWPFNGNLLPLTPQRQDNECSTGPLRGPMNSNPLI